MRSISVKRIYEPPVASDGRRILVDRLWPRGVSKARAKLDEWNKDLAPSPALRKWFDHREERFTEFKRRYRAELAASPAAAAARRNYAEGRTTLLYGARDPEINHAVVLAAYLRR